MGGGGGGSGSCRGVGGGPHGRRRQRGRAAARIAGRVERVAVHRIVVDVMLKPEILDPQGQAVANALPTLGFAAPAGLRIGRHVELALDADSPDIALAQATRMAETLLSNPVIEDFAVRQA